MVEKQEQLLCTQQQYCCNSPQLVGAHWIRTLDHLEIDKPPSQRCGEGRLELLATFAPLGRAASDPSPPPGSI